MPDNQDNIEPPANAVRSGDVICTPSQRCERMARLCSALLEDLQYRTEDRADSSLPEWEREAKELGVHILPLTHGGPANE